MPFFLEESVFCSNVEYNTRSNERIRELGSLAAGGICTAIFSLVGKNFEAAKKPIQVVEPVLKRRGLFIVTFDICDDDMCAEVRTTEKFDSAALMRPSKDVIIYEAARPRNTYEIVEAYLLHPREEFDAIDLYLAQNQPAQRA